MTNNIENTRFTSAYRPLETSQSGRRLEVTSRTVFEEKVRSPLQDERRMHLAQARALFIKLENNPGKFASQEDVRATEAEIKELILQAGIGNDVAKLDVTGQKTTQEMQARFDVSVQAALHHVEGQVSYTPSL